MQQPYIKGEDAYVLHAFTIKRIITFRPVSSSKGFE
jgi:hypothetical protein